jgi:hypothetical protein
MTGRNTLPSGGRFTTVPHRPPASSTPVWYPSSVGLSADDDQPQLYTELAPWFHLLTAPEDYELDARHALDVLAEAIGEPPRTILELGSGGGNSASHMKAHATLTLTDLSPQML